MEDGIASCKFCGATIDSRLIDSATVTSDLTFAAAGSGPSGEITPWVETWFKGSLGTIGRFQLRELLGDGAFGQVFLAYDPRLDRDVALKVLKQTVPGERIMGRFFREARAAARLDHPNIVAVFDAGHDSGRCWIAYQYIKGRTLLKLRDTDPPDRRTSVRLIRALADAIAHAHQHGVVHRDLKPTNVIVDQEGRPRLTDFGLSRRAEIDSDLTRDGAILGTPAYMSPEQAEGRSHLADERSDVYSLGVMLFELLCGRRPANLPSEAPAWMARPKPGATAPLPSPRTIDRTIPVALDRICRKALDPDPARRYPNARALAGELGAWLDRPGRARPLSSPLVCAALIVAAPLSILLALSAASAPRGQDRATTADATHAPGQPAPSPSAEARPEPSGTGAVAVAVEVAKPAPMVLIGNQDRKSMTYHLPSCPSVRSMRDATKKSLSGPEEAEANHFHPCNICHPPVARLRPEEKSGHP